MVVEIVFPLYYVQDPDIYTFVEDSWRWEHDFKAHISNHRHLYFKALFHFVFPIILDVHCPSIVQMCFSVWRWIDNQYLVATCGDLWRLPCLPEAPISLTIRSSMVTGWLACSPRDEASLWLGKRGTTDSDRVKGDGESIKRVPISSNTRGLAMATSKEIGKWKRLTGGRDGQVKKIDRNWDLH